MNETEEMKPLFEDAATINQARADLKVARGVIADYVQYSADVDRLVREIDVIINGEEGAAKQASLCDMIGQIKKLARDRDRIYITGPNEDGEMWLHVRGIKTQAGFCVSREEGMGRNTLLEVQEILNSR